MRGDETPNTLWNLCNALKRRRDSYLAQAIALDVDLYEEHVRVHGEPKGKHVAPPDLVEVDVLVSLMMTQVDLTRSVLHYVSAAAPKNTKKPKNKPLPRPKTAADIYKSRKARETYDHLQAVLVFVDDEQWKRNVAEARARGEV